MNRYKKVIPVGVIFFIISMVLFSCLEDNLTDIRLDDDTRWKPDLSLPVGEKRLNVNEYFEEFTQIEDASFPVYYENSLYELDEYRIESEGVVEYSLSEYIDSSRYIEYLSIYCRVWNHYPTDSEIQLYFREDTIVDSLFASPKVIKHGKLNTQGQDTVVKANKQEFTIEFDKERIEKIFPADNLLIQANIYVTSEDLERIRFYSDYEVRVEAAMRVKLNIRPSDLGY